MNRRLFVLVWIACLILTGQPALFAASRVDAVTFAADPGLLYVPLDEAAHELGWAVQKNKAGQCIQLRDTSVVAGSLRTLIDGTELAGTGDLMKAGAELIAPAPDSQITVRSGRHQFNLVIGTKQVEVSLTNQQLRAWQGGRLVLQTHISSGRNHGTPAGSFVAGPYRARMHYSTLFQNAPMPWSVQIHGHIFIHGFTSVPDHPASHGCIRLPLDGRNPAKFFYEWIDNGSPVTVVP